MSINDFIEDYINKNNPELSDSSHISYGDMRDAMVASYNFAKENDTIDENSIDFLHQLYRKAYHIFESKELDWSEKYDLIFSDKISKKVYFEYYDPDTSYEEDVTAFMNAFKKYIVERNRLSGYE